MEEKNKLTYQQICDIVKEVWDGDGLKYYKCFENLLKYGTWIEEMPLTKDECYEQED